MCQSNNFFNVLIVCSQHCACSVNQDQVKCSPAAIAAHTSGLYTSVSWLPCRTSQHRVFACNTRVMESATDCPICNSVRHSKILVQPTSIKPQTEGCSRTQGEAEATTDHVVSPVLPYNLWASPAGTSSCTTHQKLARQLVFQIVNLAELNKSSPSQHVCSTLQHTSASGRTHATSLICSMHLIQQVSFEQV